MSATEEHEMEAEALTAILDTHFVAHTPTHWSIDIYPEISSDPDELQQLNHVACQLIVKLSPDYPDSAAPEMDLVLLKGLAEEEHKEMLLNLAKEEAEAVLGGPSIFAITERLKDWLVEHNVKGLDDRSMYAQMMRKTQEQEQKAKNAASFEAQKQEESMTQAEIEEMEVNKRRQFGTPCTQEHFDAWKIRFDAERAANKENQDGDNNDAAAAAAAKKKKEKAKAAAAAAGGAGAAGADETVKSNRMTGFEFFTSKGGDLEALEKLEAAAEEMENLETEEDEDDEQFDEELFDEDVDLDDLDFDDDDDEDDDDEVDI